MKYYCIEFQTPTGAMIGKTELALKRDERILRFLTVRLDKYGVKYNQDKRDGKIGSSKKSKDKDSDDQGKKEAPKRDNKQPAKAKKTLNTPAPAAAPAPAAKSEEE